jgi:Skp family chaperone for outer membrane proteins
VHDFDLQEMNKTFDQMEGNFQKWADGSPSPAGIFPQQSPPANDPAPPTKPDDGHMPTGFAKKGDTIRLDSHFDEYVAKFVKDFDLSPPQVEAAESILRELKREVSEYTADKAEALAAIKKNLEEVKSLKERRDWKRRQSVITEPINELFSQLKTRLDQIPDQAQRDRYELAQRNAPNVSSQRGEKDKTASDSGAAGQSPKTRRPTPNSKEDEGSQSKSK